MLKKCLVEFIGTFFLILTVGLSVFSSASGVIPAIAIGFVLMVMVYAGGYISGGHYNPAVSFACAIRGALDWKALIPYWIAQILGGALAALLVTYLVTVTPACEQPKFELLPLIIAELLFTFALCYVVLSTAASKKTQGNSYYGLAIGATVTVGAFAAGGTLCFGAFNPAVAFGLGVSHSVYWSIVVITALANLAGGAIAGCFYKFVENEEN